MKFLAHGFLVLTILVLAVLRLVKLHAWIGVSAVCVWCFFDEWTKRSIPGRHYSTFDVMLNIAGVVLGWLISHHRDHSTTMVLQGKALKH